MMRDEDDDRPAGMTYRQWRQHLLDLSDAAYETACAKRDDEAAG